MILPSGDSLTHTTSNEVWKNVLFSFSILHFVRGNLIWFHLFVFCMIHNLISQSKILFWSHSHPITPFAWKESRISISITKSASAKYLLFFQRMTSLVTTKVMSKSQRPLAYFHRAGLCVAAEWPFVIWSHFIWRTCSLWRIRCVTFGGVDRCCSTRPLWGGCGGVCVKEGWEKVWLGMGNDCVAWSLE